MRRVVVELVAQLADEDAQILRVVFVRLAPDLAQQLPVGEDAAGVARQAR